MKVTLVCTTYNEADNIGAFLESVKKQVRKPDEVVIVDSHSTDATQKLILNFRNKHKLPIRLIRKKTTRSKGRNLAISSAKHQIIAVSDAGCILDKRWLDRITKPIIDDRAESVAGYYLPVTPGYLQKAIAPFVCVMPKNFCPEAFLPSSRSVAFTKTAWEKAGKYPEFLNYCEDLVFAANLRDKSLMMVESKAIVYWLQKNSYAEFFNQLRHYATGDVQARYWPHIKKIATVYFRYVCFALFPPLFLLYLLVPVFKHAKHIDNFLSILYLPSLQITADVAVMIGALEGLGIKNKPK